VAAAAAVFLGLLGAGELASRRLKLDPEISRKLVHLCSGVVAAFLPYFMEFKSVVILAALFIPFMLASRKVGLFPAVHRVERSTLGEIYFPLGVGLAAALVPVRGPYVYGILVMGIADALASIVGQRYGRRSYRALGSRKTFLGSAVFYLAAALIGVAVMGALGAHPPALLIVPVLLAVPLTLIEAALGGGTDNAVLPLAAAALLALSL
jgi:phytol kinase